MKRRIRLNSETPSEKALRLLEHMLSTIKGQDKPIKDLADAIEVFESELFTENKPIYVGLCAGPSGVGKTLTAELLAEYWFGDRNSFTKIPCEEYSESHSISRLIGSPAGYVGHWDPNSARESGTPPLLHQESIDRFAKDVDPVVAKAKREYELKLRQILLMNRQLADLMVRFPTLFEPNGCFNRDMESMLKDIHDKSFPLIVKREEFMAKLDELEARMAFGGGTRPKSIILFDEIEKASSSLHNILLNVIDKAQLQLANGMMTDFSNSVILMTTNVGSRRIADILNPKDKLGFVQNAAEKKEDSVLDKEIYRQTLDELKKAFPPEFLARIDRISVYRPLTKEVLRDIVDVELRKFQEKVLKNFPVVIAVSDKVKKFILSEATDKPENGARLVKNKLNKYLRKPLCRLKNSKAIKEGDTLYIDLDKKSKIVFEKEEEIKDKK